MKVKSREWKLGRHFYISVYPLPTKVFGKRKVGITLSLWRLFLLIRWG
jgi:hypothetical protein